MVFETVFAILAVAAFAVAAVVVVVVFVAVCVVVVAGVVGHFCVYCLCAVSVDCVQHLKKVGPMPLNPNPIRVAGARITRHRAQRSISGFQRNGAYYYKLFKLCYCHPSRLAHANLCKHQKATQKRPKETRLWTPSNFEPARLASIVQ